MLTLSTNFFSSIRNTTDLQKWHSVHRLLYTLQLSTSLNSLISNFLVGPSGGRSSFESFSTASTTEHFPKYIKIRLGDVV